jgi:spore coat polysaccharide biosynthesis protein SpsF
MTTAIVVQARIGSTRLPGKVLEDLVGKPVLEHVLRRCDRIPGADVVVCAIPDTVENDPLQSVVEQCGATLVTGPEDDVMARFVTAAKAVKADIVVRITADCPMIDPEVCGEVIALRAAKNAAYASNVHPRTYPKGLDCEVFTTKALEHFERVSREGREHVTTMFTDSIPIEYVNLPFREHWRNLQDHRWTLDYPEDLEFMRAIFAVREPRRMSDVLDILRDHPHLNGINACRRAA